MESRSSTPNSQWGDHQYCSSPEPEPQLSSKARSSLNGINITTKASKTNSIQFVFERNERENNYNIKQVTVKDGTKSKSNINPKDANKVLKIKAKKSRVKKTKTNAAFIVPLGKHGEVLHAQNTFVNEQQVGDDDDDAMDRKPIDAVKRKKEDGPYIMYKLSSEDGGISLEGSNITSLWEAVFEAVTNARTAAKMSALPCTSLGPSGEEMLGLTHTALRYLLEQVPGADQVPLLLDTPACSTCPAPCQGEPIWQCPD